MRLVLRHVPHPKNVSACLTLSLSRLFVSNGERNKEICCYIKPSLADPLRGDPSPRQARVFDYPPDVSLFLSLSLIHLIIL